MGQQAACTAPTSQVSGAASTACMAFSWGCRGIVTQSRCCSHLLKWPLTATLSKEASTAQLCLMHANCPARWLGVGSCLPSMPPLPAYTRHAPWVAGPPVPTLITPAVPLTTLQTTWPWKAWVGCSRGGARVSGGTPARRQRRHVRRWLQQGPAGRMPCRRDSWPIDGWIAMQRRGFRSAASKARAPVPPLALPSLLRPQLRIAHGCA